MQSVEQTVLTQGVVKCEMKLVNARTDSISRHKDKEKDLQVKNE